VAKDTATSRTGEARIEAQIGYHFSHQDLLVRALTHRSHGNSHNESLEFLGDSVLSCAISTALYRRFSRLKEGELSRMRASVVRQDSLHQVALSISLPDAIRLGEGELKSGGAQRPSILADAVEAILGAVFLDGGYEAAEAVTQRTFGFLLDSLNPQAHGKDSKTLLQEVLQSRKLAVPKYSVVQTQGAAHCRVFDVECVIVELQLRTTGTGSTRRLAEQEAALHAFKKLSP